MSGYTPSLYERDFYAWANEQAALLRAGKLAAADIAHIAEEIESMGKTEKRELISRLAVLLSHLLKWGYQPERRGRSWEATIRTQRLEVRDHLADNPSLKAQLADAVAAAYERAIIAASAETNLPENIFPSSCPWAFGDIMDEAFWPEGGAH
ncbi:uncharacterized protein DUF29 [Nitrospirillum amazonense]|uniref:Uncharacterized protein DUF29 n=1 Tax=Nitrospirillum amazonense TaxID=28077 RepID=A0A560ESH5_9PROT|nr:DUF29 domain-containing protein [Nitrospirillum amazonense]TWB12328.1 uncharacterized protein DUF29 [Nitrospirillum amazonense]